MGRHGSVGPLVLAKRRRDQDLLASLRGSFRLLSTEARFLLLSRVFCQKSTTADSLFRNLVSYLASKPAEVEILCKTLTIENGKEPVGTFTSLDELASEDLVSFVKSGTEVSTKAVGWRLASQGTCATARICISSQHIIVKQSLSPRGRAGGHRPSYRNLCGSATISFRWTGSKWSRPTSTNRCSPAPTTPNFGEFGLGKRMNK